MPSWRSEALLTVHIKIEMDLETNPCHGDSWATHALHTALGLHTLSISSSVLCHQDYSVGGHFQLSSV